MIRHLTLYLTLVVVSTTAIMFLAEASFFRALGTACVSALAKTIAVKLHDFCWSKRREKAKQLCSCVRVCIKCAESL